MKLFKNLVWVLAVISAMSPLNIKADTAIALDLKHSNLVGGFASGGGDKARLSLVARDRCRRRGGHNNHMTQMYRTSRQLSGPTVLAMGWTPSGRILIEVQSGKTYEIAEQKAAQGLTRNGAIRGKELERFVAQ